MAQSTTTRVIDPDTSEGRAVLDLVGRPRDDLVAERSVGDGRFALREGPFDHYERHVSTRPVGSAGDGGGGGLEITERIDFRLAIPVWRPLFTWPLRRELGRRLRTGHDREGLPWWSPPQRLEPRASRVLAWLAVFALISGYLGTLITQTITFAADEFGAGDRGQGITLAAVRVGVLLALVLAAASDRRGRRRLLVVATVGGCIAAGAGALSPNLVGLGATQTVSRGLSTAMALLIGIIAAEEMPRDARAYALSVLALAAGLGSGMAVWVLPVADLGISAWRIVYVVPLLAVPLALWAGARLPESKRFEEASHRAPTHARSDRIVLFALAGFLAALFFAPASQFQNEFLRDERGYSAGSLAAFTLLTTTPAGLGVLLGGRAADRRGRRLIGSIGLAAGTAFTVGMYLATGAPLWFFATLGSVLGAMAVPALGVYGAEMFPTSARGRSNGIISLVGVVGSSVGLITVGLLSDPLGGLGPAMAVTAVGPLILLVLVMTRYPETAHHTLEELNPEDAVAARGGPGTVPP